MKKRSRIQPFPAMGGTSGLKRFAHAIASFLLAIFIVQGLATPGVAQSSPYIIDAQSYSKEDGLSSDIIYRALQDSRGFLWFGTSDGLNRFDGFKFKEYNIKDGLRGRVIWRLFEDEYQRLWIMYLKEGARVIDIMDLESGTITPFDSLFAGSGIAEKEVHYIELLPDKKIVFSTIHGGVFGLNNAHDFKTILKNDKGIPTILVPLKDGKVAYIEVDEEASQFCVTDSLHEQKDVLISQQKTFVNLKYDGLKRLAVVGVSDADNAVHIFDVENERLVSPHDTFWLGETIRSIHAEHSGDLHSLHIDWNPFQERLWLGYHDRLWVMDRTGKTVIDLSKELQDLLKPGINYLMVAQDEAVWAATNSGLIRIRLKKNLFQNYLADYSPTYAFRTIIPINSEVLFASSEIATFLLDISTGDAIKNKAACSGYTNLPNEDGTYWISHYGLETRLVHFDKKGPEILRHIKPPISNYAHAYSMFRDQSRQVWIGSGTGLAMLDSSQNVITFPPRKGLFAELSDASVYHILATDAGVWLATSKGLYLWHPPDQLVAHYSEVAGLPKHLPASEILFIHQDSEQMQLLWLGTREGGLIELDTQTGEYRQFTRQEGLSNNVIYAIYEDDRGFLWMSSNYGIMQFDKKNGHVNSYLPADGLSSEEFNTGSHLQLPDGRIFFGGLNGITSFDPKNFHDYSKHSFVPPLVWTDCHRYEEKSRQLVKETAAVLESGHLALRPNDPYFTLEFALLDFHKTSLHQYAYRIEGLMEEWIVLDQPKLQLSALPPGHHDIHIKARNATGQMAANQLQLHLTVETPFYKKPWFAITSLAILGLFVFGFVKWRLREEKTARQLLAKMVEERTAKIQEDKMTIQRQAEELKELDKWKSRLYANITHEFRTPLTLILGNAEQTEKQIDQLQKGQVVQKMTAIQNNGQRLLQLVDQILDLQKMEVGKLQVNWERGDVVTPVTYLVESFQSWAERKNIQLLYEKEILQLYMDFDKDKLFKIMSNLLSNAIKFTPAGGKIIVLLKEQNDRLLFKVKDTGDGISHSDLPHIFDRFRQVDNKKFTGGTGLGLALVKELTGLLGGSVEVRSIVGIGSEFSVALPIFLDKAKSVSAQTPKVISPSGALAPKTRQEAAPVATTGKLPLVLLVEDNQEVASYIASVLKDNYQLLFAENGQVGIEKATEHIPDLIISDVMMPIKDGFEFLDEVKNDERTSHIPVIMLTALAEMQHRLEGLRRGADAYLAKPFKEEELTIRMRQLLALRKKLLHRFADQFVTEDKKARVPDEAIPEFDLPLEDAFLQRVIDAIENNLTDPHFGPAQLCASLALSTSQLHRKLKAITDYSPVQLIRLMRLAKAKKLLRQSGFNISDVAYEVGFNDPAYFTRLFSKEFGMSPSEFKDAN